MTTEFREMLDEKAKRDLGNCFKDVVYRIPNYQNHKGYNTKDTLFDKYVFKMKALEEEYREELIAVGIKDESRELDLGGEIAKVYPQLLEQAKGKVWANLEDIIIQCFGRRFDE